MSYIQRQNIFKEIQKHRGNPILSYITSIRPNLSAQMAADAIPYIINQIELLEDSDEVDFVIISNGGDAITAQRIIYLLREKYKKVNVLIPYVAYSAATILAFGADSLIMHNFSNLGPVDPQITARKPNEKGTMNNIQFGSEDIKYFIEFLRKDVKIENNEISSALDTLFNEAGPIAIGFSKRSQQLSLYLSEKLLKLHIKDSKTIKRITKHFNTSYNHSYAISRTEAKELGLNVVSDQVTENLIWKLWKDYDDELKCTTPFDLNSEIINDPSIASRILEYNTLNLPANVPQQLMASIIQQTLSQQQIIKSNNNATIPLLLTLGCIESKIKAYHCQTKLEVAVWRYPDMNIGINTFQLNKGWIEI